MTRKGLALTVIVFAAVIVGAIAVSTMSNTHSAPATQPLLVVQLSLRAQPMSNTHTARGPGSSRLLAASAASTETALSEHFDAFLEPRISATPFPAWLTHQLRSASGAVSADPWLAVYLASLAGGWAGWIVPGAHGVCVEAVNDQRREGRADCGTVARAEHGALVAHYPGPANTTRLLGLAPDTTTHVELRATDQASRSVVITNNAWTSIAPAGTSSIAVLETAGAT